MAQRAAVFFVLLPSDTRIADAQIFSTRPGHA
jgi:hypothetical protein